MYFVPSVLWIDDGIASADQLCDLPWPDLPTVLWPQAELLDVGDPYQDREADAALLVHHDPENDALLLVSNQN